MDTDLMIIRAMEDAKNSIYGYSSVYAGGRDVLCMVLRTSGQVARPVWRADFRIDGKRAKRSEVESLLT